MIGFFEKDKLIIIGKYFPMFLVFLGTLKLIVFYNSFNITIVEYLDFSEVLISFVDSIIFYIAIFLLPLLILLSFWGKSMGKINSETFQENIQMSFTERIIKDLKKRKIIYTLFLIEIIIIVFWGKWDEAKVALIIMFPGMYIVDFVISELRIAYKKQYNYYIPPTYLNTYTILSLFTIFIIRDTLNEVIEIKYNHKYYGTEVQFENEKIKSDSVNNYIGQTRNYIFFYNLNNRESNIYPKSRMISIKLKER